MNKCVLVWLLVSMASVASAVGGKIDAPGKPGIPHSWTNGDKEGIGTAYESYDSNGSFSESSESAPISKVWFTLGQGVLNEVYYPSVDLAQMRDHQLLITDGKSFLLEERKMPSYRVTMEEDAPVYSVVRHSRDGKISISRRFYTDPDLNAVVMETKIQNRTGKALSYYVLHNPAAANTGWNDSAYVYRGALVAGEKNHWQAVLTDVGYEATSVGFVGVSDGWSDLNANFRQDYHYLVAEGGNVALTGRLALPPKSPEVDFRAVVGFGADRDQAVETAKESLETAGALTKYRHQWKSYLNSLNLDFTSLSSDGGELAKASAMVLKIGEDHSVPGAVVAAMSYPWGERVSEDDNWEWDREKGMTGYHVVWPRDLYQVATGFIAVGDVASARGCLQFLRSIQYQQGEWTDRSMTYPKKGSFPQNVWTNGINHWRGLQMDQTAFPVLLTYRLWQAQAIELGDYIEMVRLAADFIYQYGPWSQQERWEENFGVSPSNIAAQATALLLAAELFNASGDSQRARRYQERADEWVRPSSIRNPSGLDAWLFTTTGSWGNGNYYLRIDGASSHNAAWDPNDFGMVSIANHGGRYFEKDVLGSGFIELVRYGVRSPLDERILSTMTVYDQKVRKDINIGPGYYRYMFDGYGENNKGRLWPLLTGERGYYELSKALASGKNELRQKDVQSIMPYLWFFERAASSSKMIAEQVWDEGPLEGKGTGSATPLNWSHAEYLKLMKSVYYQRDFETFSVVKDRYQ